MPGAFLRCSVLSRGLILRNGPIPLDITRYHPISPVTIYNCIRNRSHNYIHIRIHSHIRIYIHIYIFIPSGSGRGMQGGGGA